jgi:hypothetical protein
MRLFSNEQHQAVLSNHKCNVKAASAYNKLLPDDSPYEITRQNVKYWRIIFGGEKVNMAKADRSLKADRKIINPEPVTPDQVFDPNREYKRILVIPDQHCPYMHPDALDFLVAVIAQVKPELTVNLGDETDYHALSFHDSDPNLDSAGTELEKAKVQLAKLAKIAPHQLVCDSNHGSMVFRKAKHHGIPVQALRTYREVLFPNGGGEGWHWAESWRVRTPAGEVLFKHQASGPILSDAAHNACNLMVGHSHGNFSIEYSASSAHLYWGAYSGCLIDKDSYAFAYGKHSLRKPILGCTIIVNGLPHLIPMRLDHEGRWVGSL